MFVGVSILDFQ